MLTALTDLLSDSLGASVAVESSANAARQRRSIAAPGGRQLAGINKLKTVEPKQAYGVFTPVHNPSIQFCTSATADTAGHWDWSVMHMSS